MNQSHSLVASVFRRPSRCVTKTGCEIDLTSKERQQHRLVLLRRVAYDCLYSWDNYHSRSFVYTTELRLANVRRSVIKMCIQSHQLETEQRKRSLNSGSAKCSQKYQDSGFDGWEYTNINQAIVRRRASIDIQLAKCLRGRLWWSSRQLIYTPLNPPTSANQRRAHPVTRLPTRGHVDNIKGELPLIWSTNQLEYPRPSMLGLSNRMYTSLFTSLLRMCG